MGGAPRNPAPKNHFLVCIFKPSGCHCTNGHLTSRAFTEDQRILCSVPTPLRSTSPFSEGGLCERHTVNPQSIQRPMDSCYVKQPYSKEPLNYRAPTVNPHTKNPQTKNL